MEEVKVAEAPVVETPKAPDESLIDNRRAEVENLVIAKNAEIPEPESSEEEVPAKVEEPKAEAPKEKVPEGKAEAAESRFVNPVVWSKACHPQEENCSADYAA